jgi:general secretion pathway protein K
MSMLRRCRRDRYRGFALLIVLWMLVLMAFIVAHLTAAGRTELRIASNFAVNAAAQAAADGAIYQTIFYLADARPEYHWLADGSSHTIQIGESRVLVRIEDENGFVNPSLASPALLEGLLRAVGAEPETAQDLASAIVEWVGSAGSRRSQQELLAEYRAFGLDYAPPAAAAAKSLDELGSLTPLESIEELGRVRGMPPQLLAALRPHLTLFGRPVPNVESTDPIVAAAMAYATATSGATDVPARQGTANSEFVTARIHATARGPGAAEVTRTAIARVGSFAVRGYSLLSWRDGVE